MVGEKEPTKGETATDRDEDEADAINARPQPDWIGIGRLLIAARELAAKGKLTQDALDDTLARILELVPNEPEFDELGKRYEDELAALLAPPAPV